MYPIQVTEGFTAHRHETAGSAPAALEPQAPAAPYDTFSGITAYESGELDLDGVVELFQHLVNTGMAWQLQGHYGRTAAALIAAGHVQE